MSSPSNNPELTFFVQNIKIAFELFVMTELFGRTFRSRKNEFFCDLEPRASIKFIRDRKTWGSTEPRVRSFPNETATRLLKTFKNTMVVKMMTGKFLTLRRLSSTTMTTMTTPKQKQKPTLPQKPQKFIVLHVFSGSKTFVA